MSLIRAKCRLSLACIITYGATASGNTSAIVSARRSHSGPSLGDTGDGSSPYSTSTRTSSSPIARRISSAVCATVEPTAMRALTIAVARSAITLSPALPDSRVTARVVRTMAAASPPRRASARVRSARNRSGREKSRRWVPRARGAIARSIAATGAREAAGAGCFSRRRIARARVVVAPLAAGVAAWPPGFSDAELDAGDALLGHPDVGDPALETGEGIRGHRAALVEHQPRPHAALGQQVDGVRGAEAERLLVRAREQVEVGSGHEPGGEALLDRLEQGDERALVVEGAAAPDAVADQLGRERLVLHPGSSAGTTS